MRTLTVKVRYPDFTQATHAHSLTSATDLEAPLYPLVAPLLKAAWTQRRPLRLVSVRFSNVEEPAVQLEMFAQEDERRRLADVLDQLNRGGAIPRCSMGTSLPSGVRSRRLRYLRSVPPRDHASGEFDPSCRFTSSTVRQSPDLPVLRQDPGAGPDGAAVSRQSEIQNAEGRVSFCRQHRWLR